MEGGQNIFTMSTVGYRSEDECSVIGEKAEIGFLDFEEERSVCSYVADDGAPVIVSVPFAFKNGKPQSVSVGDTAVELITINNTTEEPVDLWSVHIFASNPPDSFSHGASSGKLKCRELYRIFQSGGHDASAWRDLEDMAVLQDQRHGHVLICCVF